MCNYKCPTVTRYTSLHFTSEIAGPAQHPENHESPAPLLEPGLAWSCCSDGLHCNSHSVTGLLL